MTSQKCPCKHTFLLHDIINLTKKFPSNCKILDLFFDYIGERPFEAMWGGDCMKDETIVMLYWKRNENAIRETEIKYGKYCYTIAYNILHSREDSEECVNDTWVGAWNTIPPERPSKLQCFLARITRNIAVDRYRYEGAQKRGAEVESAIDEYWECVPDTDAPVDDELVLKQAINGFLAGLDSRTRVIFMRRYWYSMSVKDIADSMRLSEGHISVILHRTRIKFKDYLTNEGIFI